MYKRILIANRADCARRLIRACHRLGIEAVLISARDEPSSLAAVDADNVCYAGMSRDAYANEDNILDIAREFGCEAILPGWGFLSESYRFARRVRLAGLDFIGPGEAHMQIFGDKAATLDALVPLLKTENIYASAPKDIGKLLSLCDQKSAWMLKGRYGGGGKSVFLHRNVSELKKHLNAIRQRNEASLYYVEKAVPDAQHIEFQVFGCGKAGARIIGIRDCSQQKNHQEWFEYNLNPSDSEGLSDLSDRIAAAFSALGCEGWATVEFLRDRDGRYHLLEVNPRLQVEHGVTEMSAGIDLVASAIKWSCHREFDLEPSYCGVAAEFRLYAQSAGKIREIGFGGYDWPDHAYADNPDYRLETGYAPGDSISCVYDGCLARFIARDIDYPSALRKLRQWLAPFHCAGIETNLNDLALLAQR